MVTVTPGEVFVPVPRYGASADIDECAQGAECLGNSTCTNTVGSYICSCLAPEQGEYGAPAGVVPILITPGVCGREFLREPGWLEREGGAG